MRCLPFRLIAYLPDIVSFLKGAFYNGFLEGRLKLPLQEPLQVPGYNHCNILHFCSICKRGFPVFHISSEAGIASLNDGLRERRNGLVDINPPALYLVLCKLQANFKNSGRISAADIKRLNPQDDSRGINPARRPHQTDNSGCGRGHDRRKPVP